MPSPRVTPDQDRAGHTRSGVLFSPSSHLPRRHGVAKEIGASKVDGRDARITRRENEKRSKASSSQNSKKNKSSNTISKEGTSPAFWGAGTKRQANYSEDEDYLIACAYVNVSVDPIKWVGQKSEAFWTRVFEKYVLLSEKFLL